jgi:hypothetical protein
LRFISGPWCELPFEELGIVLLQPFISVHLSWQLGRDERVAAGYRRQRPVGAASLQTTHPVFERLAGAEHEGGREVQIGELIQMVTRAVRIAVIAWIAGLVVFGVEVVSHGS